MSTNDQKGQSGQKEQSQRKDSNHHLQVKKDNTFVPKGEEKQKSAQDFQPQWKMGVPKRGSYEETGGYNEYYDPYYMGAYSNGMSGAMGMMVYPYDYMAWVYAKSDRFVH